MWKAFFRLTGFLAWIEYPTSFTTVKLPMHDVYKRSRKNAHRSGHSRVSHQLAAAVRFSRRRPYPDFFLSQQNLDSARQQLREKLLQMA
ncbi:hypothetical protein FB45DRAFT_941191 [Roridomyces roridus]|uniref:Uncharacterized protein n=1 Tax=Roridomyces roridus TaxID=1738132 RepID=A0AAD7B628_9AGAR|nr:hypothetical protein FB45DRAFT_941191 [Roridomyces roridus]